jgi:hypothetical protein
MPSFTLLYLPIILLGVYPLWFGKAGLVGAMLGGFIGGVYIENLGYSAWAESVVALLIFWLNWLLISKSAAQPKNAKGIAMLLAVYAVTLFVGTFYILWQLSVLGFFPWSIAEAYLVPTYLLNLPIVCITCPALIRAVSPKLKTWSIYSGSLWERRNHKASTI